MARRLRRSARPASRAVNQSDCDRATRPTVADLHAALDAIAPFELAAEWDNVGLLAGRRDSRVGRALLAIDLTDAVAREALARRTSALVLYHPPIFKGIRSVSDRAEAPTTMLAELLAARIAVFALHTALDAAAGGTNDVLLDAFDVRERMPLEPALRTEQHCKLVVFVPAAEVDRLRAALAAAGAGVIGHYGECSFALSGRGSFRGDASSNPTIGQRGVLEQVDEVRLEMIAPRRRIGEIVQALYKSHSYEEPAFDLYPLHEVVGRGAVGMGRVGVLRRPTNGRRLVERLARVADISLARVVCGLNRTFRSVTTAAGSFGVRSFCDPDSLVITGEFKHHDALELLKRGVTAIALGHDVSERPVLVRVRDRLQTALPGVEFTIAMSDLPPLTCLSQWVPPGPTR